MVPGEPDRRAPLRRADQAHPVVGAPDADLGCARTRGHLVGAQGDGDQHVLLNHYPHLLALSASSPFWDGEDTGYASNRAMMFQQLPTAGLPFHFHTWAEWEGFVYDQKKTGIIDHMNEIRWDIRPSPHMGTVEVRIFDGVSNIRELSAFVALTQCLIVDLDHRLDAVSGCRHAALARAGKQVARSALRPGRGDHPRRGQQRAAGDRRLDDLLNRLDRWPSR